MKTSNYILIAFFTLLITSTLTFFITSRQHDDYRGLSRFTTTEIPLPDFKVVVVEERSADFEVSMYSREENKFAIAYSELEQKPDDAFHVSNDTLYIHPKQAYYVHVFCKQPSLSVIAKDTKIRFSGSNLKNITVYSTGGSVNLFNNTADTLQIQAADGAIVKLDNNQAKFVSADLKDIGDFSYERNRFDKIEIKLSK